MNVRAFFLFAALLVGSTLYALDVPEFTPNVVDRTQTLSASEIAQLNESIARIRNDRNIWSAILIVDSTEGESIEQFASRAFEKWELGARDIDNGLLIVVAKSDRKMRIEVGYGIEAAIPDAVASRVIRNVLAPNFKEGRYFEGLNSALTALDDVALHGDSASLAEPKNPDFAHLKELATVWFLLIVVAPIAMRYVAVRRSMTYPSDLQATERERAWGRILFLSGSSVFLTLFLLINPGIFFVVMWNKFPLVSPFFVLFAYIFLLAVNWGYLSLLSENRRSNFITKRVANRVGSGGFPQAFDTGFGARSSGSSSSSSSSGSSSSSSSGGGSSGGGGASGSW